MRLLSATIFIVLCAISNGISREVTVNGLSGGVHHITVEDEVRCEFGTLVNKNAWVRVRPNNSINVYNDRNHIWESVSSNANSNWLQYFYSYDTKYAKIRRNNNGNLQVVFEFYINSSNRPKYNVDLNIHDIVEIGNFNVIYKPNGLADIQIGLNKSGSNNLSYKLVGRSYQSSNNILNISSGNYIVEVKDNLTGYIHQKSIKIIKKEPLLLMAEIDSTDCSGTSGSINIAIKGGNRHLIFDGSDKIDFDNQLLVGEDSFTVEGLFRMPTGSDYIYNEGRTYIGLFGQDNCVEIGLRFGKPAFYIYTNSGARSAEASYKLSNDGQWHHIALRSNGSVVELLLDGVVCAADNRAYTTLRSDDGSSGKPISIGSGIWRDSGDAFKGDIASISFWGKYLNNSTINSYITLDPQGDENGLLAAYNMNIRDNQKLISVKGENGTLSGCVWSDNCSYNWRNSLNQTVSTNEDLSGIGEGNYTVRVNYTGEYSDVLTQTYGVGLRNNLIINISSLTSRICEGDELLISSSASGGVGGNSYQWESYDGANWTDVIGSTTSIYRKVESVGHKIYRLKVNSHACNKTSEEVVVDVDKKIRTGRIRHVRK